MISYSDKELLDICRDRESGNYGFNLLVRKYQRKVYMQIRRMVVSHEDTDDLVQETFIKVWKHLDGFRGDSRLDTWIYRIAANESISFLKSRKRMSFFSFSDHDSKLARAIDDKGSFSGNEIQAKLQKAILKLPPRQRQVFTMKYFDEMKYEELSDILETSVGALKASYHNAVKKIREILMND